jgi:hypothetical protein
MAAEQNRHLPGNPVIHHLPQNKIHDDGIEKVISVSGGIFGIQAPL